MSQAFTTAEIAEDRISGLRVRARLSATFLPTPRPI
jgi:hypothetical protein